MHPHACWAYSRSTESSKSSVIDFQKPIFPPNMIIALSLTLCDFCDFAQKKSDSLKPPGDASKSRLRINAQVMF